MAVIRKLPVKEAEWSSADRERWLRALTANVDLEITATDDSTEKQNR